MVTSQVGEGRRSEAKAVETVLRKPVARGFVSHMAHPLAREAGHIGEEGDDVGRGQPGEMDLGVLLARRGKGGNIRTGANDNFLDPAIPFADAPSAMKVEICWKVNELGTGYDSVHVTARNGDGQLWSYELPGGNQGIIEFPQKTAVPQQPRRRSVAKLKDTAKKNKKKGGEAS